MVVCESDNEKDVWTSRPPFLHEIHLRSFRGSLLRVRLGSATVSNLFVEMYFDRMVGDLVARQA